MTLALQAELISDDPRCDAPRGVIADIKEFLAASKECGGLLTVGQAGKILGVSSSQVSVWASRGRIKAKVVLGVRMVSAQEVLALYRERLSEGVKVGRRPAYAATLSDMVAAAWEDIDPSSSKD
jgi:hypothetical protein